MLKCNAFNAMPSNVSSQPSTSASESASVSTRTDDWMWSVVRHVRCECGWLNGVSSSTFANWKWFPRWKIKENRVDVFEAFLLIDLLYYRRIGKNLRNHILSTAKREIFCLLFFFFSFHFQFPVRHSRSFRALMCSLIKFIPIIVKQ